MIFKIVLLFIFASFITLFSFLLEPDVITTNDLNGNIVPLLHFKESLTNYGTFPMWNTYINQGIPTVADPLYGIYNPLISAPILLFDYQLAIKITYLLSVFLASTSMYILMRYFKASQFIAIAIALTYSNGSYLSSRIAAGHLEKVVSFGLLPLFLFCMLKLLEKKSILWAGLTGITLSQILFSGDIYNCLYCLYILGAVLIYSVFKNLKSVRFIILSLILFLLFSAIKIFPMIELQAYISKVKEPFIGSLNALSFINNLFLPFNKLFSIFIPIEYFSTGFGWWESLAFIGPFSVLGLYFLFFSTKKNNNKNISILLILTFLFILLSTPDSPLNPFHYLISHIGILQYFHVPSRILGLWGILILISFGLFLSKWKKRKIAFGVIITNLVLVILFSQNVLLNRGFKELDRTNSEVLDFISEKNVFQTYTLHVESQGEIPQDTAYINKVLLLQSNYGLFLKKSPSEFHNFKGLKRYNDINPGYLISTSGSPSAGFYKLNSFENKIFLLGNINSPAFASTKKPQHAIISANKIVVKASAQKGEKLTLLETNYPGWKAYIDGKKTNLLNDRFLSVKTKAGTHTYEFVYASFYFIAGLIISTLSLTVWFLYILTRRKHYLNKTS